MAAVMTTTFAFSFPPASSVNLFQMAALEPTPPPMMRRALFSGPCLVVDFLMVTGEIWAKSMGPARTAQTMAMIAFLIRGRYDIFKYEKKDITLQALPRVSKVNLCWSITTVGPAIWGGRILCIINCQLVV